jgi:hypothetical protein
MSMGLAHEIEKRSYGFSECNIEVEEVKGEKDAALVNIDL